jgi:OmpA-OmpF porin, OOP family
MSDTKKTSLPPIVFILGGLAVAGAAFGGYKLLGTSHDYVLQGDSFSGYATFRSTAFNDSLAKNGLTLKYEEEVDQAKRAKNLNHGSDFLVTTLDQYLIQKPEGRIVAMIDTSDGADGIVVNTNKYKIKNLLDLQSLVAKTRTAGRQVTLAYAGATPSEYLVNVLSTKFNGFVPSDYNLQDTFSDAGDVWKALNDPSSNIAVAALWEPYITKARKAGYGVVLSSHDAPVIYDVLVASDNALNFHSDVVQTFVSNYYRRIDQSVRSPAAFESLIAKDGKLNPLDAKSVVGGIQFFTSVKGLNWLTDGTLSKQIDSTADVLVLAGRLDDAPTNPSTLINNNYVAKAAESTLRIIERLKEENPELAERLSGTTRAIRVATSSQVSQAPIIGDLQVRGNVQFEVGQSGLTAVGKTALNTLAGQISEFNAATIAVRVIGHTSATGSASTNQILSLRRAQVVVDYLKSRGVKNAFAAEGLGFSQPLPGSNPADPSNQRTEIRLVRIS